MPKVFIANTNGNEYENVETLGSRRFITMGFVDLVNTNSLLKKVYLKLKDSKPDDYLLLTGSMVLCSIILLAWMKLHRKVNLLSYQKFSDNYTVVIMPDMEWLVENQVLEMPNVEAAIKE